jgi:hypothetical protein
MGKGALAPCPPHCSKWWARDRARIRATRWLLPTLENFRFNFQTAEPSLRTNGSRECATPFVIASAAKQSIFLFAARWIASLRSQ